MKYLVIWSIMTYHPGKVHFTVDASGKSTGVKAVQEQTVWMDYSKPFKDSATAYHFADSIEKVKKLRYSYYKADE